MVIDELYWKLVRMPPKDLLLSRLRAVTDQGKIRKEVYEVYLETAGVVNVDRVAFSVVSPLFVLLSSYVTKYAAERSQVRAAVSMLINALFVDHPGVGSAVNAFYANTPALQSI